MTAEHSTHSSTAARERQNERGGRTARQTDGQTHRDEKDGQSRKGDRVRYLKRQRDGQRKRMPEADTHSMRESLAGYRQRHSIDEIGRGLREYALTGRGAAAAR